MEKIKTEDLTVGMRVVIATPISYGWSKYIGLTLYSGKTIVRITPKRTKVVCDKGEEYTTKDTVFYAPCEEMNVENRRVAAFRSIMDNITFLSNKAPKKFIGSLEEMTDMADKLSSVAQAIREKEEVSHG